MSKPKNSPTRKPRLNRNQPDQLRTFIGHAGRIEKAWVRNCAHPFARAYKLALDQRKLVIASQVDSEKFAMDMAITALSLCSGGILTSVFAHTAWSAVIKDKVVEFIWKKNWERAFKTAMYIEQNKVASFAVGGLWEGSCAYLGAKAKKAFEPSAINFPSTKWKNGIEALTRLEDFVSEIYEKVCEAADSLFENKTLTQKKRADAIELLYASQFMNPPSSPTIDEAKVAKEIELMFYMRMMLDTDYVVLANGRQKGIRTRPLDKRYGKNLPRGAVATGFRSDSIVYLGVAGPTRSKICSGSVPVKVYQRARVLSQRLGFKPLPKEDLLDLFNVKIWPEFLRDVDEILVKLESRGLSRFKKSLTATAPTKRAKPSPNLVLPSAIDIDKFKRKPGVVPHNAEALKKILESQPAPEVSF